MFEERHRQLNTGRTHWKKGHIPWNKGLNVVLKPKTGKHITCKVCGKQKYFQLNELKKRERKYCSLNCYHVDSRKDILSYPGLHSWIKRVFNKPKVCGVCGSEENVDFANISHKYKKEISDWTTLCRKHHIQYDKGLFDLFMDYSSLDIR